MTDNDPPKKANSSVRLVEVTEDQDGQRVDNFLLSRLKGVPKSRIYRLLRKGEVRVNKGRVKPETRLSCGDVVRIPPVRVSERPAIAGPGVGLQKLLQQSVVYEDDRVLVINKPAGLAVHGGSGINLGLIESLRAMHPQQHFLELVHRLDRDTSGCIMLAKKRSALRWLQDEMRNHRVTKEYTALVKGRWPADRRRIDVPLRKNELKSGERIVKVSADGKASATQFSVLQRFQRATLVKARLETGRTHQIRVHSQFAGHPLAGDSKYGDEEFNLYMKQAGLERMFLHASSLKFRLPDSEQVCAVEAELPPELATPLEQLK
ncbi:23S rRNA pseudouridine(955/2504/2580) synthase RluC [Porticoccus sp. W117]|uniref:23S rRNA pseudouridine(955/2504/2580) synthase RluC n=1 Tax=Porticoccus sp. W117 TaxID=3054777 RepID=UPI002594030F|nr:23S rRNA pseudouridine(955/2504/2580) synthase RluC [Porticoccus sp. W117]MDM3872146.1 23S rRNA pseudouridine(955/2504/2580) synthase RluC [Porticoccus sp. W117]